jgi:hypothetical protein
MTMCDDDGNLIDEKDAIKSGLAIATMDVSKMPDSDFKRGMELFQKLAFNKK